MRPLQPDPTALSLCIPTPYTRVVEPTPQRTFPQMPMGHPRLGFTWLAIQTGRPLRRRWPLRSPTPDNIQSISNSRLSSPMGPCFYLALGDAWPSKSKISTIEIASGDGGSYGEATGPEWLLREGDPAMPPEL